MTRRRARRATTVFALFLIALIAAFLQAQQPSSQSTESAAKPEQSETVALPGSYKVTRIIDGDTFEVNMNGDKETVRVIGVDTPEIKKPYVQDSKEQCFGREATSFTTRALSGKNVRLDADKAPGHDNRDRYKRLLRHAYLEDGTLLSKALIEQGVGFAYLDFIIQEDIHGELKNTHDRAQAAGTGLWQACSPYQLKNGRWQSNVVR